MVQRLFFCAAIVAIFSGVTQAGFTLSVQTFNSGGGAQTAFNVGDTVQVRLVATDTAGGSPTFPTDLWFGLNTLVTASTSDLNDATGFTTPFNTLVNNGVDFNSANGRLLGGNVAAPPGFGTVNGQNMLQFSYTANVTGITNIGFNLGNPGFNVGSFNVGGNLVDVNTGNGLTVVGGSVVVAIPEPSSMALLGVLAIGYGIRRYRRKVSS